MSNPVYISRREVIQAIRFEPLKTGKWVCINEAQEEGKCSVCAVGAVLRKAGLNDRSIMNFGNSLIINFKNVTVLGIIDRQDEKEKIETHLANKLFLPALSLKFECQAARTGTGQRTRKILADFVKANFPKEIELKYQA